MFEIEECNWSRIRGERDLQLVTCRLHCDGMTWRCEEVAREPPEGTVVQAEGTPRTKPLKKILLLS